jgi:hypothetical protein
MDFGHYLNPWVATMTVIFDFRGVVAIWGIGAQGASQ